MDNKLKLGDIIIFKAGDDWLGKSIAWITNSNVSHAAMLYQTDAIVEMGGSGIGVNKISTNAGEEGYVMRLEPEQDSQSLCKAAEAYIKAETRYDFPALVILAGLLIYRRIRPTQKFVVIGDLILRAACKEVDKLIQRLILKNPDKAMVCSQLVYQIYSDCGKAYSIELQGGDLQGEVQPERAENSIRLFDMLNSASEAMPFMGSDGEEAVEYAPEDLARSLMEAFEEESDNDAALQSVNVESLLPWAKKLLESLEEFLEKSQANLSLDSLFVTPGDILNHAKNLSLIETIRLERVK